MYKKTVIVSALLLTLASIASFNNASATGIDHQQVCSSLHSGKIDVEEDDVYSITIKADEGEIITGYCVKAGSVEQEDGGPFYVTGLNATEVTITHPSGKAISHFSLSLSTTEGGALNPLPTVPTPAPTTPAATPTPATPTSPAVITPAAGQGSVPARTTEVATPAQAKEATAITSLPYTAGNKGQTLMLVAAVVTALIMGVSVLAKKAFLKQM